MTRGWRHAAAKICGPTIIRVMLCGVALSLHAFPTVGHADETLPGAYSVLEDEPSLHRHGAVLLLEFADFYCPHCHLFDETVASTLKKEFGDRLDVRIVGFPVIGGTLPTAFEMYEQARTMGKGREMKDVLFRTIHHDNVRLFDKSVRAIVVKDIGLAGPAFEAGLASGQPYMALEHGKAWGMRLKVTHTPTIVLDGNLKVDNLGIDNIRTIINGILARDDRAQ